MSSLIPAPPSLLPIPLHPNDESAQTRQRRGTLISKILQAADEVGLAEWGMPGVAITGTVKEVDRQRLWLHPMHVLSYPQDEINALAEQMSEHGIEAPLHVVHAQDPTIGARYPGAEPLHDLLVIDGKKRYLAAPMAGIRQLPIIVDPYVNFYDVTRRMFEGKFSLHETTERERGMMYVALKLAHQIAKRLDSTLAPFPQPAYWARTMRRSQPTISKWDGVAALGDELVIRHFDGELTFPQAVELLPLPKDELPALAAEIIDENQRGEQPVTREEVRQRVKARKSPRRGTYTWKHDVIDAPVGEILLAHAFDENATIQEMIASLTHDLRLCVDRVYNSMQRHDPDVVALRAALKRPGVLAHEQHVLPSI
jgi:hypothetical protein